MLVLIKESIWLQEGRGTDLSLFRGPRGIGSELEEGWGKDNTPLLIEMCQVRNTDAYTDA